MGKNENTSVMAEFKERAKRPFGMRDKIGYAAGFFACESGDGVSHYKN